MLDTHLVDVGRFIGDSNVAKHRAEFLCKAHEIENTGALTLEMCRHRYQCADRHDTGPANTCYKQVKAAVNNSEFWIG